MIFLDSSKLEEIKKYHKMGIIRGVTTNPTIMYKDGIRDEKEIKQLIIDICNTIGRPVSVEVTSNDKNQMIKEAIETQKWHMDVNIKIPIHGPNGEFENLEVIKELNERGVEINATAMMSAQQCLLAALAGAYYVSIFTGRTGDMGFDAVGEIKKIRRLLDRHQLKSKIIAASTREVYNVIDWLDAGADIVTVTPDLLEKMIVNARSKETVQMFLKDAQRIKGK